MFSSISQCFGQKRRHTDREQLLADREHRSVSPMSVDGSSTQAPSLPEVGTEGNFVVDNSDVLGRMKALAEARRFGGQHIRIGRKLVHHSFASASGNNEDQCKL